MDAVEEIKSRLQIEDVISEYVQLKRAGRNYKGLSPFSAERTPSFMVSPEKGIWHDFSSGKGGNIFSFIMEVEGLDFKGALELLARKANVDLDQYRTGRSAEIGKLKDRLYKALELAARFYQQQFKHNQTALEYVFKKRQFSKDIVLAFRIGYSPNTGSALVDFLKSKGFTAKELQQAGLTGREYRGQARDMFRGRVMIPLMDEQGRVIGFTARILVDDPNAPKYINTPQTILYDKGRHVFGLHLAKDALRREGFAVMVEGNLDVIASHQAGIANVVATAGTALTEPHLKAINRFTGDIRLAFDQDRAGIAATERAIPIASKVGVALSIVTIPEGKDPDELIRKDPSLWVQATNQHENALDWLMHKYASQLDLTTAQGKRQFSDVLLQVVRQLPDQVEQEHYIGRIAEQIQTSTIALNNKLQGIEHVEEERPLRKPKVQPPTDEKQFDMVRDQNHLMAIIMMRPSLRQYAEGVPADMLVRPEARALLEFLQQNPDFDGTASAQKQFFASTDVQGVEDYVKMLVLLYEEERYSEADDTDLETGVSRLRTSLIGQYVETKKANLRAELAAHPEHAESVLEQIAKLDALLT